MRTLIGREVAVPRLVRRLVGALLIGLCCGCRHGSSTAPLPPADPPVPAPEGHVLDVAVATPDASWSSLVGGVGGVLRALPPSFGGMVCAAAGLGRDCAAQVDGASPAFGVVASDGAAWSYAVATKLRDPVLARAALEGDAAAPASGKTDGIELVPSEGVARAAIVRSGRDAFLVMASSAAALTSLGPYAARTLPRGMLPSKGLSATLPRGALPTVIAEARRRWDDVRREALDRDADSRARHGGRAPDFADPSAIVAAADAFVAHALVLAAEANGVTLHVDMDDAAIHARIDVTAANPDAGLARAIAAMATGDAKPLAEVARAGNVVTWLTREHPGERVASGAAAEAALEAALGARLSPDHATTMRAALGAWEEARGEWFVASVGVDPGIRVMAKTEMPDPERGAHAMANITGLASWPELAGPLREATSVRAIRWVTPKAGDARHVATLDRAEPAGAPPLGLGWQTLHGELSVVVGENPSALLASLQQGAEAPRPGDLAETALQEFSADTTFALAVEPFASQAPGSNVTLGWGRREAAAWVRCTLPSPVISEVLRRAIEL